MGDGFTVIHCNFSLKHQVRIAEALHSGMTEKGYGVVISDSSGTRADIHVCLGPWFAFKHWRYSKTLYIDRAFWGDPDCVSIHWLKAGEKVFTKNQPYRQHPELKPEKTGKKTIYLADYGEEPEGDYDTIRYHPADKPSKRSLAQDLRAHHIAHGKRSTALVDAAIAGLKIVTDDPHSAVYGIIDREQWIQDLAWHNWSIDEIASGEFLDGIGHYSKAYSTPGDVSGSEGTTGDIGCNP